MKIRCLSTFDHPKEFIFPIEPERKSQIQISKSNIFEIYQKTRQQTPKKQSLQQSFAFTNLSKSSNKSPYRLYPEKSDFISPSSRRSLTPTSNPQKLVVKGFKEAFNELDLRRNLRHEGVGIVYCRQNYNKVNNRVEETGVIMLEEVKNINQVKSKLEKYGLQITEEPINHGVKHLISDRFARMLKTDKNSNTKTQHNYFRA